MAIKTGEEYLDFLRQTKPNVYMLGEKVENIWDDPRFESTMKIVSQNHDFAFEAANKDVAAVQSPLTHEPIRRLSTHLQTSMEDSLLKLDLTRDIANRRFCAWCGSNIQTLLWAVTWETDQKHGTKYHENMKRFAELMQKNDWDSSLGKMDAKGDRSVRPSKQQNYPGVRVVKKDAKGITVSGCKVHTSYGPCTPIISVMPCRAMTGEDKDFAVAFWARTDTPGITMIAKPSPNVEHIDMPMQCPMSSAFGIVEGTTFFEDVFIPWDQVLLCGEWDMAALFPYYFGTIQRQSKCSCLAGHSDLVAGIAALVADVNGVLNKSHIQDKLTHCMQMAEIAQGCAFGAAAAGRMHPSGVFMPDPLKANAGLNYIKELTGEHIQMLHDIGGGIIVTMPTARDYQNPALKKLLDFTLAGNGKYTTEERMRALYLCRELSSTEFTGYYMGWGVNASGSPHTGHILVRSHYDLEYRIGIAKEWAGIGESSEWPGHNKGAKDWAGN
ncbi:4-hydroxybutyryl-CoA dehydratase / vinylacetyl-CoA-Delta-isomerase [Desulfatibacillum alkenivorans DSM 16219]|jgi:4-hydroxybutyryl-CoA dehydratase/vinylacetyl-CoA-Delta-isomerase|uniref:4-hydroxybutyryl-CoA dehydratase / vinylacetyl-CoA-Delta-isomerase n=1 Tax=Desulfatibacillum alkenivorans DSM 16219 TaxID=1121393 RepID=A0A1M6PDM6_9BACT|nr:4-hydroxyphenylacetate 3-hydroxylase N-terminal domain-containing protein [Desulfatibacillum alkenivorans]SHK06024.1 4-hydroxybutyryl-CoA dehydratase / vinylacetyl-CoA-Delta-isomerase [Desulfatibacillum alkenivorans DSM 16219]